jgi:hypothetical protein
MAHGLNEIDWTAPWLMPWREQGECIAQQVKQGASVEQACNASLHLLKQHDIEQGAKTESTCSVQFVPQSALPDGQAMSSSSMTRKQFPREMACMIFSTPCAG